MSTETNQTQRHEQATAYSSPWTIGHRLKYLAWTIVQALLYRPTPKPLFRWRVLLLKAFGADITGTCYVAASSKVKFPWLFVMRDRAALGDGAEVYNLARVTLGERVTVAQHAYLCAGTHDLTTPDLPLVTAPIIIAADVFIGAKAFILPGVNVGRGAVIGACAVVPKSVDPWTIVVGNPAKVVGRRDSKSFPQSVGDPSADASSRDSSFVA